MARPANCSSAWSHPITHRTGGDFSDRSRDIMGLLSRDIMGLLRPATLRPSTYVAPVRPLGLHDLSVVGVSIRSVHCSGAAGERIRYVARV
eukprot:1189260-Prorocentrum_minimum.AAC.4